MSLLVVVLHKDNAHGLRNLLASLERHVAAPVLVMDGGSTDPDAQALLQERRGLEIYAVERPSATPPGGDWVFDAMSEAMEVATQRAHEMVLFVTAQMQIVRNVTQADLAIARAAFARADASCVIDTCFLSQNPQTKKDAVRVAQVLPGVYARDLMYGRFEPGAFASFCEVGLVSTALYRAQLGRFRVSALANEQYLAWKDVSLSVLVSPFMHHCPLPKTPQAEDSARWKCRLADRLAGAGLHPIAPLQGAALQSLLDRDPHKLPFAEDYLDAPSLPPVAYWSEHPGWQNLHARGGVWRHAARLLR